MSTRVDHILDEIAQLSPEEQQELQQLLPRVLAESPPSAGLSMAALEQATATRERIRAQLLAEGKPLFSISDDLEAMREERLEELMSGLQSARRRDQEHGEQ